MPNSFYPQKNQKYKFLTLISDAIFLKKISRKQCRRLRGTEGGEPGLCCARLAGLQGLDHRHDRGHLQSGGDRRLPVPHLAGGGWREAEPPCPRPCHPLLRLTPVRRKEGQQELPENVLHFEDLVQHFCCCCCKVPFSPTNNTLLTSFQLSSDAGFVR